MFEVCHFYCPRLFHQPSTSGWGGAERRDGQSFLWFGTHAASCLPISMLVFRGHPIVFTPSSTPALSTSKTLFDCVLSVHYSSLFEASSSSKRKSSGLHLHQAHLKPRLCLAGVLLGDDPLPVPDKRTAALSPSSVKLPVILVLIRLPHPNSFCMIWACPSL